MPVGNKIVGILRKTDIVKNNIIYTVFRGNEL